MTTKNPKIKEYRNLGNFMKLNGRSNQSKRKTKHKKYLNEQKKFSFLRSENELQGDKSKSKKETDESFFKFNLKVIKTNSCKLNFLSRLSCTSREAIKIYSYRY